MNEEQMLKLLGKLANYLPNYHPRPGQQQMAQAVSRSIEEQKTLLVEGGTGIGKSMAYLVPVLYSILENGGRALIATSHKPLQDQISKKDLTVLSGLFEKAGYRPFNWVTLKGLSNYLCWNSVENEKDKIAKDPQTNQIIRFSMTADEDFSGDFEDYPFNISSETRMLLSAESEECLGPRCTQRERCYALRTRRLAEEADLVVTNHSLLSLDIRTEGAIIPGEYSVYVIDESHNFEDNATKANGIIVTTGAIRRLLNSDLIRDVTKKNSAPLEKARSRLEQLVSEVSLLWAEKRNSKNENEDESKILLKAELAAGSELAECILVLLDMVKDTPPKTEEEGARAQRLIKQGTALAERLYRISALADPNLVYYAERISFFSEDKSPGEQGRFFSEGRKRQAPLASFSLNAMPIDVSRYLEKWFDENVVVLTSATLSDGHSFEFITKRLGIRNPETLIVPSPFDYPARVRLFLPQPSSGYNNQFSSASFYNNLASQIEILLKTTSGGRALVLFTSYAALDNTWKRLTTRESGLQTERPLFRQGEAQMNRIINDFQATANGVIFGTRSWWQGVDLPGLQMVIMDKLPFPQLNDPIIKARIEDIESNNGNSFNDFMLPMAVITFRQGFGRLMRQEHDRGIVVVCDERVVRQRYGKRFIKSLPPVPVLQSMEQLQDFLYTVED